MYILVFYNFSGANYGYGGQGGMWGEHAQGQAGLPPGPGGYGTGAGDPMLQRWGRRAEPPNRAPAGAGGALLYGNTAS